MTTAPFTADIAETRAVRTLLDAHPDLPAPTEYLLCHPSVALRFATPDDLRPWALALGVKAKNTGHGFLRYLPDRSSEHLWWRLLAFDHLVDGVWLRLFHLEESGPGAHTYSIGTDFPRRVA